jgi:hypothetical protein
MNFSESISKLIPAMVEVAKAIDDPTKNRKVNAGQKQYSYAELDSFLDEDRRLLAENGLVLIQGVGLVIGERSGIITRICHVSGEWVETTMPFAGDIPKDAQALGSAITYARRYALLGILALAPAKEDDDGRAAADAAKGKTPNRGKETPDQQAARRAQHHESWDQKEAARVANVLKGIEFTIDEVNEFTEWAKVPRLSARDPDSRNKLLEFLATEKGADKWNQFQDAKRGEAA